MAQAFPVFSNRNSAVMTDHSGSAEMAEIRGADLIYQFFGTGGIKVSMPHLPGNRFTAGDIYRVYVDGSSISSAGGFLATSASSDFSAAAGQAYFVTAPLTCQLPSALEAAGKEIIVCNKLAQGKITYTNVSAQTISGHISGSLINSRQYQIDLFISDGSNWFKE